MEKKENLRFEFVEMLFALAIGQVAIELGDLIFNNFGFVSFPHVYSHLFLATFLISLSWVGWQKSQSHGNILLINSIYSVQFFILLIDLFLVMCYFIIVRGAEIPSINPAVSKIIDIKTELTWTIIIFVTYAIWDIFTKYIDFDIRASGGQFIRVRKKNTKEYLKRAWQTWICVLISIFLWFFYHNQIPNNWQAFIVDMELISLYFLFRGLKALNFDVKRKPKLERGELTDRMINNLALTDSSFPLEVNDQNYGIKIFLAVILPVLLMIFCFIIYKQV
jgi:hypothetical protein